MIKLTGVDINFQYNNNLPILKDVNFVIESGKVTAFLGKNGSGKTTLLKLITALLPLTAGKIYLNGQDISTTDGLFLLRKHCGIVFQNPDNQFVSPIIDDDIRFGLENHGIPISEQSNKIKYALEKVKLQGFEKRNIASLSGGQKQRAAAAGILAIESDILIFDECTSMLDPDGREEMLQCIKELRNRNHTIIFITQNIEDITDADMIYIIADHKIAACGSPKEVLTDFELLNSAGIQAPFPVRVYYDLKSKDILLDHCPVTNKELAEVICCLK